MEIYCEGRKTMIRKQPQKLTGRETITEKLKNRRPQCWPAVTGGALNDVTIIISYEKTYHLDLVSDPPRPRRKWGKILVSLWPLGPVFQGFKLLCRTLPVPEAIL